MTKLSNVLTHQLRELLARTGGAPAEDQVREIVEQTGASGADLRRALDELTSGFGAGEPAQQQSWRRVIADFAFSMSNPTGVRGKRAHELRGQTGAKKAPWYAQVKADMKADVSADLKPGGALSSGAPRSVQVHGVTFSPEDVAAILRSLAR